MDFSKFSDENFDLKKWINGSFSAQKDTSQNLEVTKIKRREFGKKTRLFYVKKLRTFTLFQAIIRKIHYRKLLHAATWYSTKL